MAWYCLKDIVHVGEQEPVIGTVMQLLFTIILRWNSC